MSKRRRFPVEIILRSLVLQVRDQLLRSCGDDAGTGCCDESVHNYALNAPATRLSLKSESRQYQGYCALLARGRDDICVGGYYKYLFRAVDKHGWLIDFMLMDQRNIRAAYRFLGKAVTTMRHWPPFSITTDQLGSYPKAICRLQR